MNVLFSVFLSLSQAVELIRNSDNGNVCRILMESVFLYFGCAVDRSYCAVKHTTKMVGNFLGNGIYFFCRVSFAPNHELVRFSQ